MAYGGLNKEMDAATELGSNPISNRDKQADAGQDCRPNNSQARTGTVNKHYPCSADHSTSRTLPG